MSRQYARSTAIAVGMIAFATACSDPVSPLKSGSELRAAHDLGNLPNVGLVQVTRASSAATTTLCGFTAAYGTSVACGAPQPIFDLTPNISWTTTVSGAGNWVGPNAQANRSTALPGSYTYQTTFNMPTGKLNRVLNIQVGADNNVIVYLNGVQVGANSVDFTEANFQNPPLLLNTTAIPDGLNTLTFVVTNTRKNHPNTLTTVACSDPNDGTVYVNYDQAACPNPTGLLYNATVSWTDPAAEELIPVFVIGDKEAHGVGAKVNFWGAQWWKNNDMTGTVSNGVASFKGYATQAGITCGGTWISKPGNSSNPPATIASRIAVIVTSKVIKNGNDISGDIVQIVQVDQDGGYGPNPGHAGNGVVKSVTCGQ